MDKLLQPPTINGDPIAHGPDKVLHKHTYSKIHINRPRYDYVRLMRKDCPTCKKNRFMIVFSQDWYGSLMTCLKCGDQWSDESILERPFVRGWRKDNIKNAKEIYRNLKKNFKFDDKGFIIRNDNA